VKALIQLQVKQSLNPLPPEMLERGSSEREKSSEPLQMDSEDDEAETGASFNGDVEDNLDEMGRGFVQMEDITQEDEITDMYCPG